MNLWNLLTLALLGISLLHSGSHFAIEIENSNSPQDSMPYVLWVSVAMFGLFLSVTSFIKIVRRMEDVAKSK
ncbi:MAG: hypothetical protein QXG39_06610 [Candidatus Aenigmatarchaeota archaeon]